MILQDKTTSLLYNFIVSGGQQNFTEVTSTTEDIAIPVVVDDTNPNLFYEVQLINGNLALVESTLSPTINIIYDSVDSTIAWELKSTDGQLYLLEITVSGLGRIVFLESGLISNTIFLTCLISKTIEI